MEGEGREGNEGEKEACACIIILFISRWAKIELDNVVGGAAEVAGTINSA